MEHVNVKKNYAPGIEHNSNYSARKMWMVCERDAANSNSEIGLNINTKITEI